MDGYKKAVGGSEEELSALLTQYKTPYSFLLTHDLPNETILLTEKTTVTLSNIAISEKLFFVLLEKTKVAVGKRFSITKHDDNKDCIREHGMTIETPFYLERIYEAMSSLALENIKGIPSNSIGCALKEIILHDTGLINILSKLRINEDCEIKEISLDTNKKEHVAEILAQDQTVFVLRVKTIDLEGYAVSILPKLIIHKDSMVERLSLYGSEKEHVAAVLEQGQVFWVGRVKKVELRDYAVSTLLKLGIHKGCEVGWLWLDADEKEHVAEIHKQDRTICVGRVKNMDLKDYAVSVVVKMKIHKDCKVELLRMAASKEEHVAEILEHDQGFCVGRVKRMRLRGYAVSVITKLRIHEDNTMDEFVLVADRRTRLRTLLKKYYQIAISFPRTSTLSLVSVTDTKTSASLDGGIFRERDISIELGRIRLGGFKAPRGNRRKPRYILVDGMGNEVLEKESDGEETAPSDGEASGMGD
ncbi:MAG: uncharacterized protein A8A55_1486 [Amphiamblys sp. WSBS2006]|nr:MAG: uncharacterized protein A8A55_1486 [Amphiamblys sp. WSBS2006]